MRAFANAKSLGFLATLLAVAGFAVAQSAASNQRAQAAVTIDLCAQAGTLHPLPTTDNSVSVTIWGFGLASAELGDGTPDCSTLPPTGVSLPGPLLSVNKGDAVTLKVKNNLPPGTAEVPHALSLEIPGISFDPGAIDASVGQTVTVAFTADDPGTYLYQSGGDAGRQEAMGLYGAFIVRSGTAGQAYDDASTAYDAEAPLVLSAVDSAFNGAPDSYDLHTYNASYWLINGKSYPDTDPIPAPAGSRRLLIRYLNGGYDNTTMTVLGLHEQVLAKDANLLTNPYNADAETIPGGATEDAIAVVPAASSALPNGFPIYNRQLHLTNGDYGPGPAPAANFLDGGMMTFINP
jgi:FtsP/CotA-like multicopper oxidase with cupredoxin domain